MAFLDLEEKAEESLRKIFIGGLSDKTLDDSLKAHFQQFGELGDSVVIKDHNKVSRKFGFVTYTTIEFADKCIESKNQTLDGKTIDVKRAIPRDIAQTQNKTKKIFLGGIPPGVTEEKITELFNNCILNVVVSDVQLIRDKESNDLKGFGFVTFEEEDHVAKVTTAHFFNINGKRVEARSAQPKGQQEGGPGAMGGGGGRGGQGGDGGGRGGFRGGRGGSGGGGGGRGRGAPRGGQSGGNYNQGGYNQGGGGGGTWDQGSYNNGYDQSGGYNQASYNQGGYDQQGYANQSAGYGQNGYGGYNQGNGGAGGGYWDQSQATTGSTYAGNNSSSQTQGYGNGGGYNQGGYNQGSGGSGGGGRGGGRGRGGGQRYQPY